MRQEPGPGQESVWDYPRPPALVPFEGHVEVIGLADTHRALKLMETASPPTYYIPPEDVRMDLLRPTSGATYCEWKGRAAYYDVEAPPLARAAWTYHAPNPAYAKLKDHIAFYPQRLDCRINGEKVAGQEGGFYGGWVTSKIIGPYKGAPGTLGW